MRPLPESPGQAVQATHTPGPWVAGDWNAHTLQIPIDDAYGIAIARAWGGNDEATANARLISAAPDLLEALELCIERVEVDDPFAKELVAKGRAAIAKARGQ
jgi:hypothetical protein